MSMAISHFYETHKLLLACVSGAIFVIGWIVILLVAPGVIGELPEDFFVNPEFLEVEDVFAKETPLARRLMLLAKNTAAWFLIIIGPILFQSIFAPFFGLLMADFKAKPKLMRKLASVSWIWKLLNAVREKRGAPRFTPPKL